MPGEKENERKKEGEREKRGQRKGRRERNGKEKREKKKKKEKEKENERKRERQWAYHFKLLRHQNTRTAPSSIKVQDDWHTPLPSHQLLHLLGRHLFLKPMTKKLIKTPS